MGDETAEEYLSLFKDAIKEKTRVMDEDMIKTFVQIFEEETAGVIDNDATWRLGLIHLFKNDPSVKIDFSYGLSDGAEFYPVHFNCSKLTEPIILLVDPPVHSGRFEPLSSNRQAREEASINKDNTFNY